MKHKTNSPVNETETIKRLAIWYPAGVQTVSYQPDCAVNGAKFLDELINFGFEPHQRGETLHLHNRVAAASSATTAH
jgi:hypothetical protein